MLVSAAVLATATTRPPNIIFILSDDLGYGDYSISPGVDRSNRIPTPNIQRMADNGMKFMRGYSGPVCAPSRCTLMTGRHMGRCTIRGNDGAYTPLRPSDSTVGSVLQKTHVTGLVGKWGLGNFGTTGYPLAQGFDYFVGQDSQVGCHDWYPQTIQNNTIGDQKLNDKADLGAPCLTKDAECTWANDLTKQEAVTFIQTHANGDRPFFMYLSTTTPHSGVLTDYNGDGYPVPYPYNEAAFIDSSWGSTEQHFASAVWAQDVIVGVVLDELEAQGIEEDTIVFFSGDNGADEHDFSVFDDMGPFRGKKRSVHEGGIRQTIAVQWKGTIPPGTTSNHLFAFWDLLPTAAELAGLPRKEWPETDGVSAAPVLRGQSENQEEHEYLYWEFCDYGRRDGSLPQLYGTGWAQAMRFDEAGTEWKAIRANRGSMLLFNITADAGEFEDIAAAHGDVVAKMAGLMEEAHGEDANWPSVSSDSEKCCAACYSPEGCAPPCASMPGPSPPPSPPTPSIDLQDLEGTWIAQEGSTTRHFSLLFSSGNSAQLGNLDDPSSCWQGGSGSIDATGHSITATVTGDSCTRHASGTVKSSSEFVRMDKDYLYEQISYSISWSTQEGSQWPTWTKVLGLKSVTTKDLLV